MSTLKNFNSLTAFFGMPLLFYTIAGTSSVFANGAETTVVSAPQSAQVEVSEGTEGQKFADITSEIRIGHEDWEKMQRAVHETIERHLVGRKFIEVYGPLGTGVQCVPLDTYAIPS